MHSCCLYFVIGEWTLTVIVFRLCLACHLTCHLTCHIACHLKSWAVPERIYMYAYARSIPIYYGIEMDQCVCVWSQYKTITVHIMILCVITKNYLCSHHDSMSDHKNNHCSHHDSMSDHQKQSLFTPWFYVWSQKQSLFTPWFYVWSQKHVTVHIIKIKVRQVMVFRLIVISYGVKYLKWLGTTSNKVSQRIKISLIVHKYWFYSRCTFQKQFWACATNRVAFCR